MRLRIFLAVVVAALTISDAYVANAQGCTTYHTTETFVNIGVSPYIGGSAQAFVVFYITPGEPPHIFEAGGIYSPILAGDVLHSQFGESFNIRLCPPGSPSPTSTPVSGTPGATATPFPGDYGQCTTAIFEQSGYRIYQLYAHSFIGETGCEASFTLVDDGRIAAWDANSLPVEQPSGMTTPAIIVEASIIAPFHTETVDEMPPSHHTILDHWPTVASSPFTLRAIPHFFAYKPNSSVLSYPMRQSSQRWSAFVQVRQELGGGPFTTPVPTPTATPADYNCFELEIAVAVEDIELPYPWYTRVITTYTDTEYGGMARARFYRWDFGSFVDLPLEGSTYYTSLASDYNAGLDMWRGHINIVDGGTPPLAGDVDIWVEICRTVYPTAGPASPGCTTYPAPNPYWQSPVTLSVGTASFLMRFHSESEASIRIAYQETVFNPGQLLNVGDNVTLTYPSGLMLLQLLDPDTPNGDDWGYIELCGVSATFTPSPTGSPTVSRTATPTRTPIPSFTASPSRTSTSTGTVVPAVTLTHTVLPTITVTLTPTAPTITPTVTVTHNPLTPTAVVPPAEPPPYGGSGCDGSVGNDLLADAGFANEGDDWTAAMIVCHWDFGCPINIQTDPYTGNFSVQICVKYDEITTMRILGYDIPMTPLIITLLVLSVFAIIRMK